MLKGIIFDMDGVLINTEPLHYRAWKKAFHDRGLEIEFERYKGCIGSTVNFLMDLIEREYGWDFHGDWDLVLEMRAAKAEIVEKEGFPKIKGVPEMLRRVKAGGYRMAVASSSPQVYIDHAMKMLEIEDCFDVLYTAERVANPKPAPDVFLKAAEALGLTPEECLVIEDSTNGCKAAKAAGMLCVGYDNPDCGDQDLSIADTVINDYGNVDAAVFQKIYEQYR